MCCRPLSTVTALPGSSPLTQAAKRRAEAAAALKHKHTDVPARRNMVKKEEAVDETTVKRRRRSAKGSDQNCDDVSAEHDQKQVLLPQKKRAFLSSSPGQSPAKKSSKSNGGPEGNVDNETLIRETEADLKSLSGSWTGPRHAFYRDTEDRFEPGFENLFDEKKSIAAKCSVSSVSSVNSENSSCSLKDVITLRDQQDAKETKSGSRTVNGNQGKQETTKSAANTKSIPKPPKEDKEEQQKRIQEKNYLENLMKIEKECASIQSQVKSKSKSENSESSKAGQRYEPDFNELVDDSSNELQIDMSESDDKNCGKSDKKKKDNDERRDGKGNKSTAGSYVPQQKNEKNKDSETAFASPVPFRDSNEQSKLPSNNIDLQTPIGPFPAGATFVGYPPANVAPSSRIPQEEKPPVVCLLPLKPATTKVEPADESAVVTSTKVSVSSPENPASKQYTILQPAGAGSRAASAIKDVAQKGVPGVPAVSSSTSANADSSANPKTLSLSPSAIGKGNSSILFYLKLHLKYKTYGRFHNTSFKN